MDIKLTDLQKRILTTCWPSVMSRSLSADDVAWELFKLTTRIRVIGPLRGLEQKGLISSWGMKMSDSRDSGVKMYDTTPEGDLLVMELLKAKA